MKTFIKRKLILQSVTFIFIYFVLSNCKLFETSDSESESVSEQNAKIKQIDYNVEVFIDSGDNYLGSFTFELFFNPEIFQIKTITNNTRCNLIYDENNYKSGKIKIMGFFSSKNTLSGKNRICTIEFIPLSKGTSFVEAKLIDLYDFDGKSIEGKLTLSKDSLSTFH